MHDKITMQNWDSERRQIKVRVRGTRSRNILRTRGSLRWLRHMIEVKPRCLLLLGWESLLDSACDKMLLVEYRNPYRRLCGWWY